MTTDVKECVYCHGKSPSSDGRTPCGWCNPERQEARESRRDMRDQLRDEKAWDRPDRSEL